MAADTIYLIRSGEDSSVRLYQFYLDEFLVDFTFYCANKEKVRCHRIVLLAYSDSLRELVKGTNTCYFTIVTFTAKTVKKFLEFLYTGKVLGSKNEMEDVQEFAKVYGVKYRQADVEPTKKNNEVHDATTVVCEETVAKTVEPAEPVEITISETEKKNDECNKTTQAEQSKEVPNSESVIIIEEDVQIIEINDSTEAFDRGPMKPSRPELTFISLPRRSNNQPENNETDPDESFQFSADIEILENGRKMTPASLQSKFAIEKHSTKQHRTTKKRNNQDGEKTPDSKGLVINPFSVLKKKKSVDDGPSTSTQIHDVSIGDKNGHNGPLPKKSKRNSQL